MEMHIVLKKEYFKKFKILAKLSGEIVVGMKDISKCYKKFSNMKGFKQGNLILIKGESL